MQLNTAAMKDNPKTYFTWVYVIWETHSLSKDSTFAEYKWIFNFDSFHVPLENFERQCDS